MSSAPPDGNAWREADHPHGEVQRAPSAADLNLAEGWRRRFVEITAGRSWSPTGIVAYGRTPKKEGAHGTNGLDARPAPERMNLKKYRHILQGGIYTVKDLELAKELIVKVSPMGRAIFAAFDRFLEAEEGKGTPNPLDPFDGKFEFIFPGEGTYAARKGHQDRATSWGSAISIEAGESVFALIHEIVHAMPLDQLPAELLRIPYRSPDREGLSFEDRFVRHIESAYHDEAISGLAEVVLFDDLRRARAPLPEEGEDGYVDHVRAVSRTYAKEGLDAYLDSELYIGRNHRIDYNVQRLIQTAVLALAEPETLRDVTVSSVLAEGGITVTAPEGSAAAELLEKVKAAMDSPTPENIQALVVHLPRLLKYVTLDPEVMVQRIKEFFEAYTKGKNPRRGRGFLGKRDVTVGGLRLLGKARAVYNDYIQESTRRSPATGEKASDPLAGITDEEFAIYKKYIIKETEDVEELKRKVEEGDRDALRELVIIGKVSRVFEKEMEEVLATEEGIEDGPAQVAPEDQFDFGDAPDVLDALWNMTLDLAHEASGKRRDELIARARELHTKLNGTSMGGGTIGIPSHHDLYDRYGLHGMRNETIESLSDAWERIRNLHAAVILRDRHGAATILETIGSLIAQAFKQIDEIEDRADRTRALTAFGIEVPGIMASVGRIMRTAWKVGLPLKQAYGKQLAAVAKLMFAFFLSESFDDTNYASMSRVIMISRAFGARAQADYVSFFFDLLDNRTTKKLAEEWARFFVGSPLGVFFYRRLHASFDEVARRWKEDFDTDEARKGFGGYGFHPFFLTLSSPAYNADEDGELVDEDGELVDEDSELVDEGSELVDEDLMRHAGYGNYLRLIRLGTVVRKGSIKDVRAILNDMSPRSNTRDTLTIPVRGLPVEPSRVEGALVYGGKGGAPRFDIALGGEYAPLLKVWGKLMALPLFDADTKEKMLQDVGETLAVAPLEPGAVTLYAALKMHYAHMIAVHGDVHDADAEVLSYDDVLMRASPGGEYGDVLNRELAADRAFESDMASLVKAQIALAAHDKGDHEEARRRVEYLHDYYTSIVHLRREGVYPDGMARAAEALSRHPAYRDIARKLLGLAVEHVAVFKNDEEIFPRTLEWLIRSIDGAALPYDVREELMSDLVRTVIPEVRATSGYSPQEMQLKAYHVSRVNDVIYERGLSAHLARYESAEALLYNRTADLIDEYGGMATSDAMMRGRFLQAAMRVNRELAFTKPQLVDPKNIPAFERMDEGSPFQLDLADIFPEQLAAFDADAPVDQWNPTRVRRGLPDPEQSFGHIAQAVEDDPSQGALEVYAAFVRWEVDRAAASQPRNTEMLENILAAYKQRIVERESIAGVEDVTGLSADDLKNVPRYAAGLGRMLSRRELMALRETLALPSVAFAFDRLGSIFGERRDLSAADERIILAALDARGPHESQGKRELFLYTLFHDTATLLLKRRAAYNLALSFNQEETVARLIDAYEKSGDEEAEARFYKRITGIWQLTGQLPSDYYLMLLDGAGNGAIDPLDRLEALMRSNGAEARTLDIELRYGWQRYYGRFIDDMQAYIDAGFKLVSSIVHRDQVVQYLGPLKNDPERARALVRELKVRHLDRLEEIDIAKANLPNIFLKQPPVVRFLLLSYFGELGAVERARLAQEMNELERAEGRAETFMHFFQMAGLEKLGQTLSTFVGIVPEADRTVFARLQDKVPAGSAIEVRETIEREQRAKIDDLYEGFDDTPIASASIAEVYRAHLKETGEEVYLKVIPGSKRRKIVETAKRLRRVAAKFEEHSDRFAVGLDIAGMITWFADELEGQLDLRKERRHAISFRNRYDALTPRYYSVTGNVLVMRPLDGFKVTDLDASSPHRETAARRVAETGVKAVLEGYYHADPHPGNIFVSEGSGEVSWLDFGTMGVLGAELRIQLMNFLFTLAMNDARAQRMALEAMGTPDALYDSDRLEAAIAELAGVEVTERAARIIALAGEHRLFVQHQCSQAIANLLMLKGVVAQLDPAFDFSSVFAKLMPAAYAAAREEVGGARSPAKKKKGGGGSGSSSASGAPSPPSPPPPPPPQHMSFSGIDLSGPMFMDAPSPTSFDISSRFIIPDSLEGFPHFARHRAVPAFPPDSVSGSATMPATMVTGGMMYAMPTTVPTTMVPGPVMGL